MTISLVITAQGLFSRFLTDLSVSPQRTLCIVTLYPSSCSIVKQFWGPLVEIFNVEDAAVLQPPCIISRPSPLSHI